MIKQASCFRYQLHVQNKYNEYNFKHSMKPKLLFCMFSKKYFFFSYSLENRPIPPSQLRRREPSGRSAAAMLLAVTAFRLPGCIGLLCAYIIVHQYFGRLIIGLNCPLISVFHKIVCFFFV